MAMSDKYILDDSGNPVQCNDLLAWARWFESGNRVVARSELIHGHVVSTVFLGLDHNFSGRGDPVLYETMAFNDYGSIDSIGMRRYRTRAEALAGHDEVVTELVRWLIYKNTK